MSDKSSNRSIWMVLAVFMAVLSIMYIFGERPSGIHGDIRKGKRHIDRGNFTRGIFYLHRAHDKAPQSPRIISSLMSGYLEYARHTRSLGDIDRAVEIITLAYEMDPESIAVANEKAYYLSERGFMAALSRDMPSAGKDIERAIELAEGDDTIRRNIANYFLNRSLEARDKGDRDTQLMCLLVSSFLNPGFKILYSKGWFYYHGLDQEKAIVFWDKALEADPGHEETSKMIDRARKEIGIKDKMKQIDLGVFKVIFYEGYELDKDEMGALLLEIYDSVGKDLEHYPPVGTVILLYNEKDFRDIFGKDGTIMGFYDGNIRLGIEADIGSALLPGIVAHEYTHALVSDITDNRCPVWLHEGLAVYQQSKYMDFNTPNVEEAIRRGNRLSIKGTEKGFEDKPDHRSIALSYEASYTAVNFILEKWGWRGMRALLLKIKEEGHFTNALDEQFHISVPQFEDMWNDHVRSSVQPR